MANLISMRLDDEATFQPSWRDLQIANKQNLADSQKVIVTEETLRKDLAAIEASIKDYDTQISSFNTQIDTATAEGNTTVVASLNASKTAVVLKRDDAAVTRSSITGQLVSFRILEANAAREAATPKDASGQALFSGIAKSGAGKTNEVISSLFGSQTVSGTPKTVSKQELQYNASTVRESYLSSTPAFTERFRISGNSPSAVGKATDLWTSAKTSKGMIVTSAATIKAWNSGSQKTTSSDLASNHNYGFQFMYNPGTVNMNYYTSPNVDVALMTSGQDLFNLTGVSGSQGSIGFQVIINRVFDMQYFDKNGVKRTGAETAYSKPPADNEWRDLYNKGTMYDVEYLLRTLMGTTMNSYLRGTNTADMGWLPAMPVELHLGKSLRYLGTINNISLNHTIFDERMVPLFTTVDISFARLPDYPAAG